MDPASVTLGLAFLAGIASFLSPCVLALVPVYVGYLSGRTAKDHAERGRLLTFFHGLAFVVGFGLVFVVFGAGTTFLSRVMVRFLLNIKGQEFHLRPLKGK